MRNRSKSPTPDAGLARTALKNTGLGRAGLGRAALTSVGLILAGACAPAVPEPKSAPSLPANAPSAQTGGVTPAAVVPTATPREVPEWRRHFESEHVQGSIAILDTQDGILSCSDVARCTRAAPPASTFKVPHAAIALELGVLDDAESEMRWDGKTYSVPDWNRDHTLRTAMRVSCVPCFQNVARQIGPARLSEWVARFGYGNQDTSGAPDRFWLDGALRISPVQQIEFLRKLDEDKLPLQKRTSEIVKDVIALDVGPNHVLRGKTGMVRPPEQPQFFGWFVGWVELGPRRVYFATLLDGVDPDVDPAPVRRRLTESILRAQQLLP